MQIPGPRAGFLGAELQGPGGCPPASPWEICWVCLGPLLHGFPSMQCGMVSEVVAPFCWPGSRAQSRTPSVRQGTDCVCVGVPCLESASLVDLPEGTLHRAPRASS